MKRDAPAPSALIAAYPGPALLADAAAGIVEVSPRGDALARLLDSGEAADLTLAIFACSSDLTPRLVKLDCGTDDARLCLDLTVLPSGTADEPLVMVLGRDVTVERKLTEALVASRRLFKDIEAVSSDFGWETDLEGRFVYVSVRGALGYTAHELDKTSARRLAPQPQNLPDPWPFESRIPIDSAEIWLKRKDGSEACVELSSRPVQDDAGKMTGARGVARDVTERKTAEAARARAEAEAIAANDAKSRFLAIMSHELRTPINGVIGNLELLKTTLLDNDQGEMIHSTELAAESLLRIIGDILDFSKIEAGKIELERLSYEPARLVYETVSLLNPSAVAKGIGLEGLIYPSTPVSAILDPFRVRQIMMNLIGNALKFTEHGGIFVSMSGQTGPDGRAWLSVAVEDTGIGFDAETVDLFAPFTQADGSTTRRFGGSGLGLSICRGLVERMGGMIGTDARPGEGATFWFAFPVDEAQRRENPLEILRGHRIAILSEDDEIWRAPIARMEAAGLEVLRTAEARDCLAVVTDRSELGRADFGQARRIFARGSDNLRERRLAHALGFSQVIGLPPDPDLLLSNLAALAPEELPAQPQAMALQIDDADGLKAMFAGRTVLALEDNPMSRNVIQRQFATLGIALELGENGRVGLEALEAGTKDFALVLTDCAMPEIAGYLFTQILRRRELGTGRHLPVIAMTANAAADDARKCLAAGMDDYLAKPVRLAQLVRALSQWGGGEALAAIEAAARRADGPVDLGLLAEILGDADPGMATEALNFFAEVFPAMFETAQKALETGDFEDMADAAHGAKGAARNAGALDLGLCLSDAEASAKSGDAKAYGEAVDRAAAAWGLVQQFIAARARV